MIVIGDLETNLYDIKPLHIRTINNIKNGIKDYFSGETAAVQFLGGCGALFGRSLAAYFGSDLHDLENTLASMGGSTLGYLSAYTASYYCFFRNKPVYKNKEKSMIKSITKLQLIEQSTNVLTLSFLTTFGTQYGLLKVSNPIVAANAANFATYISPNRIMGVIGMLASNSYNKSLVYGTWNPKNIFIERPKKIINNYMNKMSWKKQEDV